MLGGDVMKIASIINGAERMDGSGETMEVRNPYSGDLVAEMTLADEKLMEEAIENSRQAFQQTMKKMPAYERSDILRRASDLLEEKQEEFAEIVAREAGKPIKHSRAEIKRSIQVLRFSSELSKHMTGEVLPMDAALRGDNRMGMVKRVPMGVIGAITPFNFPLNLSLHKIAPAIAAGNTVIFKPAEKTPVSAYMLSKLFQEAGLPDGVLNLVLSTGKVAGSTLVPHKDVPKITFTGSLTVGKIIRDTAGFKKVTMELGSNSPNIVFEDADIDDAVERLIGAVGMQGGKAQVTGLSVRDESNPGGDIEIRFTGLRAGEKLYEELLVTDTAVATRHPLIMREIEPGSTLGSLGACLEKLERAIRVRDNEQVRVLLFDMVESYNPTATEMAS